MKVEAKCVLAGLFGLALGPAAWAETPANPAVVTDVSKPSQHDAAQVGAVSANDLIGREITTARDTPLGEIEAVQVDGDGNVRRLIVGLESSAGASRPVALEWSDVVVSDGGAKLAVNAAAAQVRALPTYRFSNPSQQGTVFTEP
ncbi:MAG: hypothetical protein GC201_04670 [Alphaproteobacteria bacterium]|nr:hypothetical protein [Alphaproteobacteria bacterium]